MIVLRTNFHANEKSKRRFHTHFDLFGLEHLKTGRINRTDLNPVNGIITIFEYHLWTTLNHLHHYRTMGTR